MQDTLSLPPLRDDSLTRSPALALNHGQPNIRTHLIKSSEGNSSRCRTPESGTDWQTYCLHCCRWQRQNYERQLETLTSLRDTTDFHSRQQRLSTMLLAALFRVLCRHGSPHVAS